MSAENVEIVRQLLRESRLDVAEEGALERFVERLAPDAEFEEDPRFPEADTFRGREAILGYMRQFLEQFDQFEVSVEEFLEGPGDSVLVCQRIRGRGKGSNAEFDFRPAWLYTVKDGAIVRIRAYFDRAEGMEAAGLR